MWQSKHELPRETSERFEVNTIILRLSSHNFFSFLSAAVQRKYESLRRVWKMEDDDNYSEIQLRKGKEKKYRARRRRVRNESIN